MAALTSAISLLEPLVSWLEEHRGVGRVKSAVGGGIAVFVVGLGTVFSFNHWAEFKLFGRTLFDNLDFLTNNIMMPVGGLFIALFAGWLMARANARDELHTIDDRQFSVWYAMVRYVCPIALVLIFISVAFPSLVANLGF